uniref:Uncharacterized protein n=1 Tax=Anopheles dirus TaxID=7168 RepID=A0A182NHW3_9DIPT
MASFKNRIAEKRLYVTVGAKQSECDTTSSIMLDQSTRVVPYAMSTFLNGNYHVVHIHVAQAASFY